jgi:hypothetical protein
MVNRESDEAPRDGWHALARWEWEGGHIMPERDEPAPPGRRDQPGRQPQETSEQG